MNTSSVLAIFKEITASATVFYRHFDNIVNNPVPQKVIFSKPIEAKALRLIPVETREDEGYASREFTAVL